MLTSIPAIRVLPAPTASYCLRCGIDYQPGHTIVGERKRFCADCRPEATFLGWCEPTKHGKTRTKTLAVAA